MAVGATSGTYNFSSQFSCSELLIDAFERCGKNPAELTQTMLISARRSLNLVMQAMASKGPALWAIQLYTTQLQPGIATITLPPYVSSVLDVYVRQYINTTTINEAPSFTTNAGQANVNIYQPNHGLLPGQSVFLLTQVSIGGLVLAGWYQIVNVPDQNDFTITAASNAASSVTNGGVLPSFTTTNTSASVSVNLPNHGLATGSSFNVPITTSVGGLTLQGSYMVTSVTDANNFVINAIEAASADASAILNGGQVQLQEQTSTTVPTDRILMSMSRTDYSSLPYKAQQGFPYTYWMDRVVPPTLTFWNTPDQNGPYLLNAYYLRQLQDANLGAGEIPDLQFRALEMMTAKVATKLSVKYAPDRYQMLKLEYQEEFGAWESEESEKVPLFIRPEMDRYWD